MELLVNYLLQYKQYTLNTQYSWKEAHESAHVANCRTVSYREYVSHDVMTLAPQRQLHFKYLEPLSTLFYFKSLTYTYNSVVRRRDFVVSRLILSPKRLAAPLRLKRIQLGLFQLDRHRSAGSRSPLKLNY